MRYDLLYGMNIAQQQFPELILTIMGVRHNDVIINKTASCICGDMFENNAQRRSRFTLDMRIQEYMNLISEMHRAEANYHKFTTH